MSDSDWRMEDVPAIHERLLLVAGVLGGMAFTALVFLLQACSGQACPFKPVDWGGWGDVYFGVIVTIIGFASSAFAFSSVLSVPLAANTMREGGNIRKWDNFSVLLFFSGFFGLLVAIPTVLIPFNWLAALFVGVFEFMVFLHMIGWV